MSIDLTRQDPREGLRAVRAILNGKTIVFHPDDIELIYEEDGITDLIAWQGQNFQGEGRVQP